ncbi:conserved hypothetical protein [Burkholderiales bacterium 8X]|nr:conserved hypothetical protein [Burkholderiales bacterium 8X]
MSTICTAPSLAPLAPSHRAAAVPPAVRRGAWQLAAGEATRLKAREASVLKVRQGRVWITLDANRQHGSEDLVLAPGESLRIAAGTRLVMEPWDGDGATYTFDAVDAVDALPQR